MTEGKTAATDGRAKRCFMITPIGSRGSSVRKHADWVFRYVQRACSERGIELDRADTMSGSAMINTKIFQAIRDSEFCVADLTGLNANVFYELGVRHSLSKPVIHIAHVGMDLPFDNAQHDTVFFDLTDVEQMEALTIAIGKRLDEALAPDFRVSNPFTAAIGALQLQQSGDPRDQIIAALEERLAVVERRTAPQGYGNALSLSPFAASTPQDMLLGLVTRAADGSGLPIGMTNDFVRRAVAAIPDLAMAKRIYDRLEHAERLSNRGEIERLLEEKYPELSLL